MGEGEVPAGTKTIAQWNASVFVEVRLTVTCLTFLTLNRGGSDDFLLRHQMLHQL